MHEQNWAETEPEVILQLPCQDHQPDWMYGQGRFELDMNIQPDNRVKSNLVLFLFVREVVE